MEDSFPDELLQFSAIVKLYKESITEDIPKELSFYRILIDHELKEAFPNVEIALRMYLVLMVSNCSGERSFSKMKMIKNRLRATMTQNRLAWLTLMSTENDILRELDFEEIIHTFVAKKSRKVHV